MKIQSSVAFLFASSLILTAASLSTSGCADADDGTLIEESDVASLESDPEAKADRPSIPFTTFTLDGTRGGLPAPSGEVRKVFKTAGAYRAYFGQPAPASVDFRAGDWVAFYDAGRRNSGGYTASIQSIRRSDSGRTLKVVTRLTSPGEGCPVTLALTRPYVLARFRAPTVPPIDFVQFYKDNVNAASCVPVDPCATVRCAAGTHCEVQDIVCITTPCNPIAQCVPDSTEVACTSSGSCGADQYCTTEDGVCNSNCAPGMICAAVCWGTCQARPATVTCASIRCAQGYQCVDHAGANSECVRTPGGCTQDSDCQLYDQYCSSNPCACEVLGWNQRPATCSVSSQVQCFVQPCRAKRAACSGGQCTVVAQ